MRQVLSDITPKPTSPGAVHLIHDADEAGRRSLKDALESAGHQVETYASADSFLATVLKVVSGCVILHLRRPIEDDLHLLGHIKSRNLYLPMVIVSGHGDVMFAVKAMKAGAAEVVERPYTDDRMIGIVRAALDAACVDLRLASQRIAARAHLSRLSKREYAVLRELVTGRPNKLVAHALKISPRTVEIHRANMMQKLSVGSLAEVVRIFIAAGSDY